MKWRKLEEKQMQKFFIGIVSGLLLGIVALVIFNEMSFIIGGIAIMIIGFSLLYYLIEMKKR